MLLEHELRAPLANNGWSIRKSLDEVFRYYKDGDCLLLCDDNIVSGSQAECQFLAWSNVPRDQWQPELRAEHGIFDNALDKDDIERLQQMPLAIAVCTGSFAANDRLSSCLPVLGYKAFRGVFLGEELRSPQLSLSPELERFLSEVGTSLLAYCRYGEHDKSLLSAEKQDRCRADALGYDGARGLLATLFNVPTFTLTPLWCPGLFRNAPWMPLVIRRGYIRHLVLG